MANAGAQTSEASQPARLPKTVRAAYLLFPLALIAFTYWPVHSAGFVWDDIINFVDNDWLTEGDLWQHYLLRDFNDWVNYFRPLVVALFTFQLRVFNGDPGPMHLASLGLHLTNTLLVGLITELVGRKLRYPSRVQLACSFGAMLFYGLHPALIETVAWIGCQFDLVATLFMLTGALAGIALQNGARRTLLVCLSFFMAASSKESAAVFPALILLVEWALLVATNPTLDLRRLATAFMRRNAHLAMALVFTGAAYLAFRNWGLGHLLLPTQVHGGELDLLGHSQRASDTLLQYAKLIAIPWIGLNVMHPTDAGDYSQARPWLLAWGLLAFAGVAASFWAAIAKRSALACLPLVSLTALLPVLNLAPSGFAVSLYHERYVIVALAFGVVFLPLVATQVQAYVSQHLVLRRALYGFAIAWAALSITTIQKTLPNWQDDETLWRWAYAANPSDEIVQYNLSSALIRSGGFDEANALVEQVFSAGDECVRCALVLADREMDRGNLARASRLIELVRQSRDVALNRDHFGSYMLSIGHLLVLRQEWEDAIVLLEEGLKIHSTDVVGHVNLASALRADGRLEEARLAAHRAILLAPERDRQRLEQWKYGFDAVTQPNDEELLTPDPP